MARITLKGNPIHTVGYLPGEGRPAPAFKLTGADLSDVGLDSFGRKRKILNIVPSLDTGVCAASAKRFSQLVTSMPNTVLLNISADLPFAAKRFCDNDHLSNIITLSTFRSTGFGKEYGVEIIDGPLAGLMSRAVIVLDEDNKVLYSEQVPEIAQEPNYAAAAAAAARPS